MFIKAIFIFLLALTNLYASSVDCYKAAMQLKEFNQVSKSKQSFAFNLCKGSDDLYPIKCYEEILTIPDYIIPTLSQKHYTALTLCKGATKTNITPMSCFLDAIQLTIGQTQNFKSPIDFAIEFCKAKHQYL